MKEVKIPVRYVPKTLSKREQSKQVKSLMKSRKLYKKGKYYTRPKISSYNNKPSKHVDTAKKIYDVDKITPNKELSQKTGCTVGSLEQIVTKGEGAYYSSGSRPNQTAKSWGLARLASSITGGKSAAIDYKIIENGCNHKKKAYLLAKKALKKYNYGRSKTKKQKFYVK